VHFYGYNPHAATQKGQDSLRRLFTSNRETLLLIHSVDLGKSIPKKEYEDELGEYQRKLALLTRHDNFRKISIVALFEANDKYYARIKVLKTLCKAIERAL
jgi:polyphosphate kinase 2 (PPK2 family)